MRDASNHAAFHREGIDHVQRRGVLAPLVGAAEGLAVEGHDPCKLDPIGVGERRHEPPEHALESLWVQHPEHSTERVVAGNAVLQPQDLSQHSFLGTAEQGHVATPLRPTQDGSQSDEQNFPQFVLRVRRSRVRQLPENFLEFVHGTPRQNRESSSESIFPADATSASNPYAIPLPFGGGIITTSAVA